MINRMGFNNQGLYAVAERLKNANARHVGQTLVKQTQEDAVSDYVVGTRALAPLSDYLVVNVSSPNTPGPARLAK